MINTTIAHYKIIAKIGKGGMGEVYRATDTKLDRDVAIKILPESFAGDRNRLARFNREAKVLAALNHPNIAVIHGVEHNDDTHALVMELVEGETLGERLKREPMTVEESLDCCKQIAEALEAAHEKGIIHRDLKPDNIKITDEGHVKVLDFGLAKVVVDPSDSNKQAESPTITHMTSIPGELLGTAPYMSPEQARAKPVDKRSDIWSFGCVLFECLTGKRMFGGEDVTETLASIIKGEPEWSLLPENTPPTIQLLLRKCLNKDRKRRLHDIADARIDLEQALGDPTSSIIRLSDLALQEAGKRSGVKPSLAIGAVVLATLFGVVLTWSLKPDPPLPLPELSPIRRLNVDLGVEGNLYLNGGTAARLSPDGSTLAYLFVPEGVIGQRKLYLRRLDQLEPTELTAAEGATQFCFSPDGKWIVFVYDERALKKVSITGGAAITLRETVVISGIDWSDDGWIIIGGDRKGLSRVSSSGGPPEPVTTLSEGERTHRWPQVLPGGQAVLYTAHTSLVSGFDDANIMVQRLPEGKPQLLWQGGHDARYLSSGHLVYLHQGTLFASAFDLESLTLTGQPSPVLEEVAANIYGTAHFDVSAEGTLVYVRGSVSERLFELEWVDRKGGRELLMPADDYRSFKLSPDGRFLAYSLDAGEQADIWIYDIERGVPTKFTFDPANDDWPVWSPSGESIVFSSDRDGIGALYWKRTDGSGEAQRLTDSENPQVPWSWHPDGRDLAIFEDTPEGVWDVRILELAGDDRTGWTAMETTDFQATRFLEASASFSPDGLWLAYASNESEQYQVFVRSFPGGGGKKQISIKGLGSGWPTWSQTNQELVFISGSSEVQIFTVKYRIDEGVFIPDRPVRWEGGTAFELPYTPVYDLHPDGERLLVRSVADVNDTEQTFDHVVLFENFFDYVRERLSRSEN